MDPNEELFDAQRAAQAAQFEELRRLSERDARLMQQRQQTDPDGLPQYDQQQANESCDVELVGGPHDGEVIRVRPSSNAARPWKYGHELYQYRRETGKAHHVGKAPA